ncbi:hypothetical protein ASZ78_015936, partial [Callipepla squamata]
FLSTSNEAVYKVFSESECPFTGQSCDPETFNASEAPWQCPDAQCLFAFYGGESRYHRSLTALQIFNLFMLFWLANFAIALGQVTLAGAFASYYWAFRKPHDMPAFPLFSSFGRALRYHTGSLAFGALILAIVQIIRVILEYLDHRLKGARGRTAGRVLIICRWPMGIDRYLALTNGCWPLDIDQLALANGHWPLDIDQLALANGY